MKKWILFLGLLIPLTNVLAQTTPAAKPAPKIKFKAKTWWKNYKDSVNISVEDGLKLLPEPLVIKDDKNVVYKLVSYGLVYTQVTQTQEDEFAKTKPTTHIVSRRFDSTPLNELWQSSIREQLKSGEELFFFDVVFRDDKGKLHMASNLKIKIR